MLEARQRDWQAGLSAFSWGFSLKSSGFAAHIQHIWSFEASTQWRPLPSLQSAHQWWPQQRGFCCPSGCSPILCDNPCSLTVHLQSSQSRTVKINFWSITSLEPSCHQASPQETSTYAHLFCHILLALAQRCDIPGLQELLHARSGLGACIPCNWGSWDPAVLPLTDPLVSTNVSLSSQHLMFWTSVLFQHYFLPFSFRSPFPSHNLKKNKEIKILPKCYTTRALLNTCNYNLSSPFSDMPLLLTRLMCRVEIFDWL